MTALPNRPTISVEEYLQFDRSHMDTRNEYIDGYMTMLAGGTLNHATICANTYRVLYHLLRGTSCQAYTSDARVRLSERRYVYPDVTITCDQRDQGETDSIQSPHLIFEVLSPSTEAYDRGDKFFYYRECPTIQEYVLVSTKRPFVEVFRREKNNLWTLYTYGPNDEAILPSIGRSLLISAIYEDIVFPGGENQPA